MTIELKQIYQMISSTAVVAEWSKKLVQILVAISLLYSKVQSQLRRISTDPNQGALLMQNRLILYPYRIGINMGGR